MTDVRKANALFAMTMLIQIAQIFIFAAFPNIGIDAFTAMVLPELVLILPSVFYVFVLKNGEKDDISQEVDYKLISLKSIGLVALVTYAAQPITSLLNMLTSINQESAGEAIANMFDGMPYIAALIAVGLVPAVCEEFVFRGCIYGALRKKNRVLAIVITSIMFGLLHLNLNQFSYAFALGIVLCLMVEATGTVLSSTIAHFIFNGTSVTLTYILTAIQNNLTEEDIAQLEQNANASGTTMVAGYEDMLTSIVVILLIYFFAVYVVVKGLSKLSKNNGKEGVIRSIFSKEGLLENNSEGRMFDIYSILGIAIGVLFIVIFG